MKKMLAIVMTFAVLFGIFSVAFAAENGAVDSIESVQEAPEGYTAIRTAEDLNNIRNDLAGKYILMNDIDLSVYENWAPIGTRANPFTGELNGNKYTINNLSIDFDATGRRSYVGLFGYCKNALIKRLAVVNASVKAKSATETQTGIYMGIVVAEGANLEEVAVTGTIVADNFYEYFVGGICGEKAGVLIDNCVNYADVTVKAGATAAIICVGGIVGELLNGNIKLCSNFGNISVSGKNVSSDCEVYEGGIVGYSNCQMRNTEMHDSYNRGKVSIDFSTKYTEVGGLAGESGTIINAYGLNNVSAPKNLGEQVGTLVGYLFNPNIGMPPYWENLYYLDGAKLSYDETKDENIYPLTEEEFKKQESFVGFDFDEVWAMEENGYPVLQNQPIINVKEDVELEIGETFELPDYESVKSADESIAKANENKLVALSAGTTTVTLTHAYGYYTEYTITVAEEETTTEPTTEVMTTEPVTETTTEKVEVSTTIPEPSTTEKEETTQPTTAPATEPETQPSTVPESTKEPATEPTAAPEETTTEPADDEKCPLENCWLIKFLKQFFHFVCEVAFGSINRLF